MLAKEVVTLRERLKEVQTNTKEKKMRYQQLVRQQKEARAKEIEDARNNL